MSNTAGKLQGRKERKKEETSPLREGYQVFSASEQDTEHQAIAPVYMSVQSSNGHWGEQVPIDDLKISLRD